MKSPFSLVWRFYAITSISFTLSLPLLAADSWPDFRGPTQDGHAASDGVPLTWSESENVKWKTELPLLGLSSPIVKDNQVWLTTATENGHDFYAICVDAKTGEIILNEKLFHSDDPQSLGNGAQDNSYATPSAVIEDSRVYLHYGSFGTACINTSTMEVIWKREDLKCWHYRGASSSPVIFENLLILTFDGADLQYLVALDKTTGETVWKTDRSANWNDEHIDKQMVKDGDWRKAHSTPLIVSIDGKPVMCSTGAKAVYGYDPRTGKELWRVDHEAYSAAPRPVFHDGHFIVVTGFSKGAEMMSIRAGGHGVVTDTHVEWTLDKSFPKYSSPILVDDLLYFAMDDSFLVCVEAKTGEVVWKGRAAGKYRACPIYADGKLYFFSLEGVTTIIEPGREFKVVSTNSLATDAPLDDPRRGPGFMASPAVVGNAMFLRTRYHLYRVESE
ncbi:MAG: quinonprotein alcohol dehydrogenase [Verrucomicrobiales bacterium]|nr:quinonprotein alcohol dehydrogenase [Verrucomicrobiales bacterium]